MALAIFVGLMIGLPRAAGSLGSAVVQIADGIDPGRLARLDDRGNLLVATNSTAFTVHDFGTVTVPAGGKLNLPQVASIGGHITIFVVANQPGRIDAYECVPVAGVVRCVIDAVGKEFAGDAGVHQANDDNLQGTEWRVTIRNIGTTEGTYSVTVLDRPLGGPPEKPGV